MYCFVLGRASARFVQSSQSLFSPTIVTYLRCHSVPQFILSNLQIVLRKFTCSISVPLWGVSSLCSDNCRRLSDGLFSRILTLVLHQMVNCLFPEEHGLKYSTGVIPRISWHIQELWSSPGDTSGGRRWSGRLRTSLQPVSKAKTFASVLLGMLLPLPTPALVAPVHGFCNWPTHLRR